MKENAAADNAAGQVLLLRGRHLNRARDCRVCKLDARHKQRQGFHTLALEAARAAPDPPAPQSRTLGPPDARALLGENPWALSVVTTWSALGEPLRRLFPRF